MTHIDTYHPFQVKKLVILAVVRRNQHQPDFVCPTFPFCYQDLKTGAWKAKHVTLDTKSSPASTIQESVASDSAECWMDGYFCRSATSNLINRVTVDNAEDCQAKCAAVDQCLFFSFMFRKTHGEGHCSLLSKCNVKRKCATQQNCATGGKTCSCPALKYLPGNKESPAYARWTCKNIDPLPNAIPLGTVCNPNCANWEDSALQSTCLKSGKWSNGMLPLT